MGLLDRFRRKPIRKTGIAAFMENNLEKEARTPVYSGVSTDLAYREAILPPVDQNYLELLAERYSHLRTVVTRIASQTVAKEWELIPLGEGDSEEKAALSRILRDPTNGHADITGMEFFKAMIRQLEVFDDCWVSIVYDRVIDSNGEETGKVVKELWVEDAKHMRFYVDGYGKFMDDKMFDPLTREFMGGTHNKDTGTKLVPMAYFYDVDGDQIPFARDEVIHFNKYSSTARLYGQSPIIGLSKKIETALAIENLQNKVYRLERPPKGFLDIPGHNEDSLNRLGEYIAEETRRNPNFIPIISSQEGTNTAKFVSIMPNFDELMMLPYMERINNDINAAYGVMPLVVGDMSGVGGLNSEGEQITIFDRTIRETQRCIELGLIKPLLRLMGIKTWTVRFHDINERNETQYLNNMNLKAQIITQFQNSGIDVDLGEDGELVLPKSSEAVRQDFLRRTQESLEEEEPNEHHSTLTELYENLERS